MGKFMQEKGDKKAYLMTSNYQAGKDMLAGFTCFFKSTIVDAVFTQVGQTDDSTEISQLQVASPDTVFTIYPGGMGVHYIRERSQAAC